MSNTSPASQAEATAALRALFTAFPSDRGDIPGISATYRMAVDGYSLRAIEGAVKRIIRGEDDGIDQRFLPTPAQLGNLVAYMEKLYAPPERAMALPAPGSETRTAEEQARIDALVNGYRKSQGTYREPGEQVFDREAMPQALREQRDREIQQAASKLKGPMTLSPEALAIFRKDIAQQAIPSPDEQFDNWAKSNSPEALEIMDRQSGRKVA